MEDRTRGLLATLAGALCLSTVPTVVKLGLRDGADPLQLLAPRLVLGCVLLWTWVAATRPQRLRIDRRGLRDCALAGGINAAGLMLFYLALRRVDASVAMLIFSVYPAILLLMLHLHGEAVNRRDLVRLGLALAGVALVADVGGAVDIVGVMLLLACATIYSLYVFVLHTRLASYPASTLAVWIVTFVALAVVMVRPFAGPTRPLEVAGWGVVLWSAIFGTALARMATVEGVRLLGGGQTALLLPVETVLAVSWATLILGERIGGWQIVGAGLVLTSVLLATIFRRRPSSRVDGPTDLP